MAGSTSRPKLWGLGVSLLALGLLLAAAPAAAADPVIAAAGDIACGTGSTGLCAQQSTSDVITQINPDGVLLLGDDQYENGSLSDFQSYYDPTWGRFKSVTHPAPGNHEYQTTGAAGYFDYFNGVGNSTGPADDRSAGYYSFDIGSWHIVALNSNCTNIGSCSAGSPEETWLRNDLATHPAACTLAYMHHPRWSSDSGVGSQPQVAPLVQALYDYHADLMLAGHAHTYERFGPQDPAGNADTANGLVEIISGTGGKSEFAFSSTILPNSLVHADTLGALKLTLHPWSYDWEFVPAAGQTFSDSGTGLCHGRAAAPDTTPPSAPTGLAAQPGDSSVNLSWVPNTESDLAGYDVYRATSPNGTYTKLNSSLVTTADYTDTGLMNGVTHYYYVIAVDTSGNASAASAVASATPAGSGPLAVTNAATKITRYGATLNGTVTANGQATTYHFEYGKTTSYGLRTPDRSVGASTTASVSAIIGQLRRSNTYHYRLVASWSTGQTAAGADVTFRTLP
jgi:hypothetical protein